MNILKSQTIKKIIEGVYILITMVVILSITLLACLLALNILGETFNAFVLGENVEPIKLIEWLDIRNYIIIVMLLCCLSLASCKALEPFEKHEKLINLKAKRIRKQNERSRYRESLKEYRLEKKLKSVWWNC